MNDLSFYISVYIIFGLVTYLIGYLGCYLDNDGSYSTLERKVTILFACQIPLLNLLWFYHNTVDVGKWVWCKLGEVELFK